MTTITRAELLRMKSEEDERIRQQKAKELEQTISSFVTESIKSIQHSAKQGHYAEAIDMRRFRREYNSIETQKEIVRRIRATFPDCDIDETHFPAMIRVLWAPTT